jgi:penicillin-insensitive murein DD-endopeptidase
MIQRPKWARTVLAMAALGAGLSALSPSASAGTGRDLPRRYQDAPFSLMSLTVGYPNAGFQLRAKKLKNSEFLKVKDNSRDNVFAHPALVLMLERSAREVARLEKGSLMVVGDLSSRDGGPLAGHVSHQSGRDADIGFYLKDSAGRPIVREHFQPFDPNGRARYEPGVYFDDYRNWLLLRAWVTDDRAGLAHIFVSTGLRWRLIEYGRKEPQFAKYVDEVSVLLKQPAGRAVHDDHFHVRIACPDNLGELCYNESRLGG